MTGWLLADETRLAGGVDGAVARFFHDLALQHPPLALAGIVLSYALSPWAMRGWVILVGLLVARRGRPRAGALAIAVMLIGGWALERLKVLIGRPRPQWADPVFVTGGESFPSGHAFSAALGGALLLTLLWPWIPRRRWACAGYVLLVVVTCLDRLVIGVHYLSDVCVGALLGGLVGGLSWWLIARLPDPVRQTAAAAPAPRPPPGHPPDAT